jgi:transposase InsO family protein
MHKLQQHKNARLTPLIRQEMVNKIGNGTINKAHAGRIYGIHRNTVSKWVREVDKTGNWLCLDNDSCPEKFRIQRGLKRLDEVQRKINKRLNRDRMRYVKDHPGELVHIDTKKLPFIEGEQNKSKEYLYVAVDDATRYLYAAIMGDKTDETAGEFMEEVLATSPFIIDAVMTDNGREYRGKLERGHGFETVLDRENIKHIYTKIKTPKTNGKAERIMRTVMAWHRMIQFGNRQERSYRLSDYVEWYNSKKGHSSLKGETPFEFLIKHLKLCEKCTQRWQS